MYFLFYGKQISFNFELKKSQYYVFTVASECSIKYLYTQNVPPIKVYQRFCLNLTQIERTKSKKYRYSEHIL